MNCYLITFDLNKEGQDYESIIRNIEGLRPGDFCKCLKNVWIVKTSLNSEQIRKKLEQFVDSNDQILVANITHDTSWSKNLKENACSWLNDHLNPYGRLLV